MFAITVEEGTIYVTTRGYGHRVGMSQYGAEAMAVSGSDYTEILRHYYTGTAIRVMIP
jgi:stage II sporulation protein D